MISNNQNKEKTILDFYVIKLILKNTLLINILLIFYYLLFSYKISENHGDIKFIIASSLFWIIISIVEIIIRVKNRHITKNDLKFLFFIVIGFSPLYGIGIFPLLNNITTVNKIEYKGKILEKRFLSKRGSQIKIKINNSDVWIYTSGIKLNTKEYLDKNDYIELTIEKGIMGVLKNPKIELLLKGESK